MTPSLDKYRYRAPLTRAEELTLIADAKRNDPDAHEKLHAMFQLYLIQLCHRMTRGWMNGDDREDIISEARLALQRAIRTFDATRKARFATWLRFMVRRYVLAYVEKRKRLSGPDGTGTVSYDQSCGAHFAEGGHVPSVEVGGFLVRPEASFESAKAESSNPAADAEKLDLLRQIHTIIEPWSEGDRQIFVLRITGQKDLADLIRYLPPNIVRSRRAVASRFRRLRREVTRKLGRVLRK